MGVYFFVRASHCVAGVRAQQTTAGSSALPELPEKSKRKNLQYIAPNKYFMTQLPNSELFSESSIPLLEKDVRALKKMQCPTLPSTTTTPFTLYSTHLFAPHSYL